MTRVDPPRRGGAATVASAGLVNSWGVVASDSRAALLAAWVGRPGAPAGDLVRLRPRLPARPRAGRPRAGREGVFERPLGRPHRDAGHAPDVRADVRAVRRPASLARRDGLVDVLELRVHGRRARAALGVYPPPRALHQLP